MKYRHGFVSNSSSSSFLLVTSEQEHQRVLDHIRSKEGGEQIAKTVDLLVGRKSIGEIQMVVFAAGSGEVWEDYDPIDSVEGLDNHPESPDGDDRYNAERTYKKACKEIEASCITQDLSL